MYWVLPSSDKQLNAAIFETNISYNITVHITRVNRHSTCRMPTNRRWAQAVL